MKVIVVKEEGSNNPNFEQTYVGTPFSTEHEARMEAIKDFYMTHFVYKHHHHMDVYYFENETQLRFISDETGEIFCEYFLLITFF